MLSVLDLFSGIGGFSLGLERTGGFATSAFCEIDTRARRVLAKHWPDTKIYEDIKSLNKERMQLDGIYTPAPHQPLNNKFPNTKITLDTITIMLHTYHTTKGDTQWIKS